MPGSVFLRGETVTLHPVEPDDAAYFAKLLNDPDVRQGIAHSHPMSEADEREWIESLDETSPTLMICVDGEPVGNVGLDAVVERWGKGEIGYLVEPDAWNQGHATDAVATFVEYLFDELRYEKLVARVFETNAASERVLEKVGFEREGTSRGHAFVDGERVDLRIYGLLAAEFRD